MNVSGADCTTLEKNKVFLRKTKFFSHKRSFSLKNRVFLGKTKFFLQEKLNKSEKDRFSKEKQSSSYKNLVFLC